MNKLTPLKAIRVHCIDCSGYSPKEVRLCVIPQCPLYPYRMGTNPSRKGVGGVADSRQASPVQKNEVESVKNQENRPLKEGLKETPLV